MPPMTPDNEDIQKPKPDPASRLGRLRPRDTSKAVSRSAAYSRLVGLLRWALPVSVLIGLASLAVWPMLQEKGLAGVLVKNAPNLMIEKLHLTGMDAQNQAYSLTADRALQAGAEKNLVDLEKPQAEISLNSGAWLAAKAAYGRLDQSTKRLWLGGTVEIFHDRGYRFLTDEMDADMKNNTAWGEKPVLIQGPFGEIRGTGFRLLDSGKAMIVTGPATARLDLQAQRRSGKPSGNTSGVTIKK